MHKQKTIEKTLPVTRFGSKYGVRVLVRDEAQIRAKMGAEESPPRILVQQIYEMRPLPHGTTRKGLTQMLSELGCAAKPVQPGRADASGMSLEGRSRNASSCSGCANIHGRCHHLVAEAGDHRLTNSTSFRFYSDPSTPTTQGSQRGEQGEHQTTTGTGCGS